MSHDRRARCPVTIPSGVLGGVFSNAFRIVEDNQDEYLLDFLQYDPQTKTAEVIARIRVRGCVMEAIRDRLTHTMGKVELGEVIQIEMGSPTVN